MLNFQFLTIKSLISQFLDSVCSVLCVCLFHALCLSASCSVFVCLCFMFICSVLHVCLFHISCLSVLCFMSVYSVLYVCLFYVSYLFVSCFISVYSVFHFSD